MANAANSGLAQNLKAGALSHALGKYEAPVENELETLTGSKFSERLWCKDAGLWTGQDENQWLGWLDVVGDGLKNIGQLQEFAETIKKKAYNHAVLLGMGGSSLCVEVMRQTFGRTSGYPTMLVLDSVVPAQVKAVRKQIDPGKTIFVVASKSGSTTEPNVLFQYFFEETRKAVKDRAGEHFVAITDPGSSMEKRARECKFAHIFYGVPSIGGRFSALSNFGMVSAAIMGLDLKAILTHAAEMVKLCGADRIPGENAGVLLGTILGVLTRNNRDKVTIFTSPAIASLGTWLEQLIAESTGKEGKGVVPVAQETLFAPGNYGDDRLFVYIRLASDADEAHQDAKVDSLEKAGQPVVRIYMPDITHLGAEFFRWEVATATAGSLLGINTFNQPNVQESKDFTKEYLAEYASEGELPEDKLLLAENGYELFADDNNARILKAKVNGKETLKSLLAAHLSQIHAGDYFAINAYLECCPRLEEKLQRIRDLVMRKYKVATTVGFGPRFLHSTGQLHKGGPDSGVFLQITSDDAEDLQIPEEKFSFGILKQAQSLGDFKALSMRNRRLLRLHFTGGVDAGLDKIYELICESES
jgi:transaldolase / glucose-6-phosphate isomerase